MQDGTLDPQFVITHTPPLKEAAEAYRMFNDKQTIKVCTLTLHIDRNGPPYDSTRSLASFAGGDEAGALRGRRRCHGGKGGVSGLAAVP